MTITRIFTPTSTLARTLAVAGVTVGFAGVMWWGYAAFGARSVWFSFFTVWFPTAWFAVVDAAGQVRLPPWVYRLRPVELRGRLYELLGVRVAKKLLRRGPLSIFSRGLRLHGERTPQAIARLEQQMLRAETAHLVVLVAVLPVAVVQAWLGWWDAMGWTLLFDVLVNAYPAMVQRYNRAWLQRLTP